jgi:hypothetical protein
MTCCPLLIAQIWSTACLILLLNNLFLGFYLSKVLLLVLYLLCDRFIDDFQCFQLRVWRPCYLSTHYLLWWLTGCMSGANRWMLLRQCLQIRAGNLAHCPPLMSAPTLLLLDEVWTWLSCLFTQCVIHRHVAHLVRTFFLVGGGRRWKCVCESWLRVVWLSRNKV